MKKGEVEFAERQALNLFDEWIDATGCIDKFSTYYYEAQACIIDAVHCGIQIALNKKINIEDGNVIKGD